VIGASAGMFGAVWAQAELRKVLGEPNLEQEVHEVITTLLADAQSTKTSPPDTDLVAS